MPMPETSVDEDDRVPFWEHNVGMPRQFGGMQAIAETKRVQMAAHKHLWLRVFRPNTAHHLAALLFGNSIHCVSLPLGY